MMLLFPRPNHQRRLVLVLVVIVSLLSLFRSTEACEVLNAAGETVTNNFRNNDDQVVVCQGDAICQNFTITNCRAVHCIGSEACFQTTMTNIGELVECQDFHSCHRSIVHFAEDNNNNNNNGKTVQSMTCQGEGACNVAEIRGSHLQLECFGRKACRKINAIVDSVHCTHGETYGEACTEYAHLQANCVLCGYVGCESHVNHCATKPMEAPEDARWVACLPHQAIGIGCTPQQIQALENEIATDGQVMAAQELEDVQKETIEDNGGSK